MAKGEIVTIRHFSLNDGPGIRTTVFFFGCPLRCLWCHNPESWKRPPGGKPIPGIPQVREMTVRQVMEIVHQDNHFYRESGGGLTLSGGEPLEQPGVITSIQPWRPAVTPRQGNSKKQSCWQILFSSI